MNPGAAQPSAGLPHDTAMPDSPRFLGEGRLARMAPDLKVKIAFVVLALGVLVALGFSVKNRWAQNPLVHASPAGLTRADSPADRKSRVFEQEEPPANTRPPIVLPNETKQADRRFNPTGLELPHLALAPPPPAPVAPKAMMVGEALRPVAQAPASKATAIAIAPGLAKTPASAPAPLASPVAPTVQTQAQLARERQGDQVTATAQVSAAHLGRRHLVLTKGSFIPCVLETQLVSNVFGMTSCVVTQNVYSDDGKLILIERGAKVTGNYGSNLRNGDTRLAVIWDRIKTPKGVVVDVNSPGSDGVGAMGFPGRVDHHWWDRIGAAVMLSLMQDTMQYATSSLAYQSYLKEQREIAATQPPPQTTNTTQTTVTQVDPSTGATTTTVTTTGQTPSTQGGRGSTSTPPPVPVFGAQNTAKQGSSIPEQVLATSINAAPTLYKNRGDVVYIFVANDIWFDRVYGVRE